MLIQWVDERILELDTQMQRIIRKIKESQDFELMHKAMTLVNNDIQKVVSILDPYLEPRKKTGSQIRPHKQIKYSKSCRNCETCRLYILFQKYQNMVQKFNN